VLQEYSLLLSHSLRVHYGVDFFLSLFLLLFCFVWEKRVGGVLMQRHTGLTDTNMVDDVFVKISLSLGIIADTFFSPASGEYNLLLVLWRSQ